MLEWISAHPLLMLLAGASIATFIWLMLARRRLEIKWYAAALIAVLHVLCGVLCVKLFAVAEAGFDFSQFSGQSLFGAVFFLPLFYYLGAKLFRRKPADVFDCFAVPMIFTLFCARISCLITGCCLGRQIPGSSMSYPTREAELIFYAVLLIILIPRVIKNTRRGTAYPIFLTAYGAFRFVCEFFRESKAVGVFHIAHLWAALAFIAGISLLLEINNRMGSAQVSHHTKHWRKTK